MYGIVFVVYILIQYSICMYTYVCLDEDRVGPLVLSVLLGSAILINFIIKVYHISSKAAATTTPVAA